MEVKYIKSLIDEAEKDGHFNTDDIKILVNELSEFLSTDGAYDLIAGIKKAYGIE